MKIKLNHNKLELDADGDYIISKNCMFDLKELETPNKIIIEGFSGSVGHGVGIIPDVAKFLGYSKFQVLCFRLLSRAFNKKFKNNQSSFLSC